MNTQTNAQMTESANLRGLILKRMAQVVFGMLLFGVVLFASAGRLNWVWAWAYMGTYAVSLVINVLTLLPKHPEMVAGRAEMKEDAKGWDRPLAFTMAAIGPMTMLIVAGLDERFGWSPELALAIHLVALVLVLLGYRTWGWAMAANDYFEGLVRIQKERGHTVVTGGPYRYVRHPGYAGMLVFTLATPLLLDSLWALIPAGLTVIALVVRTALEDRTLREELDGYAGYAQQTRYRLLPGIW